MTEYLKYAAVVLFAALLVFPPVETEGEEKNATPNRYMELLHQGKQAHEKAMATMKKASGETGSEFDPDKLILRRYDEEIAKAQKTIAAGGRYEKVQYDAARKRIAEETKRLSDQVRSRITERGAAAIAKNTAEYNRKMAEIKNRYDSAIEKSDSEFQRKTAEINLTQQLRSGAGKTGIVIWNLPMKPPLHDRSTVSVNVQLLKNGRAVWTKKAVRLNRRGLNTPVRLPSLAFDKVTVEIVRWSGEGGGLSEIEVYVGDRNLALGRPCEVSNIETVPMHLDDRNAVTDGIVVPTEVGNGYWISEPDTKATVTIDLLGQPDDQVIAAARQRAARAIQP